MIELTVVLALMSIITTFIISFSGYTNNLVMSINKDNEILKDYDKIRVVFYDWVSSVDDSDYGIYATKVNDRNSLVAINLKNKNVRYTLSTLEDGTFYGTCPKIYSDQNTLFFRGVGNILNMEFKISKNDVDVNREYETSSYDGNLLIECIVTYAAYNYSGSQIVTNEVSFLKTTRSATLFEE